MGSKVKIFGSKSVETFCNLSAFSLISCVIKTNRNFNHWNGRVGKNKNVYFYDKQGHLEMCRERKEILKFAGIARTPLFFQDKHGLPAKPGEFELRMPIR
jgi:hypothetical protein